MARALMRHVSPKRESSGKITVIDDFEAMAKSQLKALCTAIGCTPETLEMIADGKAVVVALAEVDGAGLPYLNKPVVQP